MARLLTLTFLLIVAPASGSMSEGMAAVVLRDSSENFRERPVAKIVRMLKDMEKELRTELEDDKAVYDMLDCWCSTNEKEKTKAIELGTAQIAALEASIEEASATMAKLKAKRKATQEEQYADEKALGESRELRMKENKEFQKHETDVMEAIAASDQAVTVLSKHHSFDQLKSVGKMLRKSGIADLLKEKGAPKKELDMFTAFLQESEKGKELSFLQIPGMKSNSAASGQIFGILKQMKADFEDDLSAAQKAEKKAVEEFNELKSAKEAEIATAKKMILEIDEQLAELAEKHAEEVKELANTEEQLALDQEFLANLKKKCAQTDAEFDKRVKDRMTEIEAVEDTIGILNSDDAFDSFEKTVNNDGTVKSANAMATTGFLQIAANSQQKEKLRQKVADLLQNAAARTGAASLALLSYKVRLNDFTEVKAAIDKMVVELKKQQVDEVEKKDWCTAELNSNAGDMAAQDDKKTALLAKIADLESEVKTLGSKIADSNAQMKDTQEQMGRRSSIREAENSDNSQTISDQRLTQIILAKALTRMKQVYLFLQQHRKPGAPHIQTSGTHTDPGNGPAGFKKYDENAGGKRVVAMLDECIADSQKMEDDTLAAELDSQAAYEDFMIESNQFLTQTTKAVVDMTEAKAKSDEDLTVAKKGLKKTMSQLEALNTESQDLHADCDYVMKNFDTRQAARAAEMDALGEAKNILSGM